MFRNIFINQYLYHMDGAVSHAFPTYKLIVLLLLLLLLCLFVFFLGGVGFFLNLFIQNSSHRSLYKLIVVINHIYINDIACIRATHKESRPISHNYHNIEQ